MTALTPELLLRAYAAGIFPMAESADDPELFWVDPERRGMLPLDGFHLPRRLRRTLRAERHRRSLPISDFPAVIRGCAEPHRDRPTTWINDEIVRLYTALHRKRPCPQRRVPARRRAGRRALRRGAGRRVLRRKHVQPHDRRQQGGAGPSGGAAAARRLRLARHPVRDRRICSASARSRSRARAITGGSSGRSPSRPIFRLEPLDGAAVASLLQSSTLMS